jgi:hypothetical protein
MKRFTAAILLAITGAVVAYFLGDSYIDRLPDHRGNFLVPVEDRVTIAVTRPRHTVLIVVDGLRADAAAKMTSTNRLRAVGQCRRTDVGSLSFSRPVYAVLSTGLEQDRTGARNNDLTTPLAAESIWEVARAAKLDVVGASELPWWRQLFPHGFTTYIEVTTDANAFAKLIPGDLTLVHPVYLDETAHDHGGASPAYAHAVAQVDSEIGAFLDTLDLSRDTVLMTSDHGHTDRGGHGGLAPDVATVLSCWAGRGITARTDELRMDSRDVAPTLAVLLGLRLPRHVRAVEDDLDVIWEILDPAVFPAAYVLARRQSIANARETNRTWLAAHGADSWTGFYTVERRKQSLRLIAAGAFILATFAIALRRRPRQGVFLAVWMMAIAGATTGLHVLVLGSFDFSSINKRVPYIQQESLICLGVGIFALAVHVLIHRDMRRAVVDQAVLVWIALLVNLAHPLVYGWPLGFPIPSPELVFLPFIASVFLLCQTVVLLPVALLARARLERV